MSSNVGVALPFFVAAGYYSVSPFFGRITRQTIQEYLEKVSASWQGPTTDASHLEPASLAQLTDWITDAPQLIPTLLLPIAGALFAVTTSANASNAILAGAVLVLSIAAVWIYHYNPVKYGQKRLLPKKYTPVFLRQKYTLVSFAGLVLNLAVGVVLLISPLTTELICLTDDEGRLLQAVLRLTACPTRTGASCPSRSSETLRKPRSAPYPCQWI